MTFRRRRQERGLKEAKGSSVSAPQRERDTGLFSAFQHPGERQSECKRLQNPALGKERKGFFILFYFTFQVSVLTGEYLKALFFCRGRVL